MRFSFAGGAAQDPGGKEGLANFISGMLDEGAGDMTSVQFQERQEDLAVRMSFDAGRDMFTGSFQTLKRNADEAAQLLHLALTKPRFDADAVDRIKKQIATGLKFDMNDPRRVASKEWFKLAFKDHPYARPVKGTMESVARIGGDDLRDFARKVFTKDSLKISVVGDIDAKTLGPMLDKIFGDLPEASDLKPIAEAPPPEGPQRKVIEMNVPQSVAVFGHGGFKRKDEDFIESYILNYILGGGGFNSRLTEEVREKRGLAYSVYSYLSPYRKAAIYLGNVATENKSMTRSLKVIQDELQRMADKGPSAEELKNAKQYLTGSYALRFDTSSKIANQLLWIQIESLGKDYIDTRNGKIEAVTLADIRRVAKRLIKADGLIVTIVGKPSEIAAKPKKS
jgi:zinc protease